MMRNKNCPAKGKKCAKCRKYGHFAACCKTQTSSGYKDEAERSTKSSSKDGWRGNRRRGTANCVEEEEESNSDEDEFALLLQKRKIDSQFVVTDNGRCLLGNASSKALGILRIGTTDSLETDCNSVHDIESELKAKYPKVFSGIGKLTDYQLQLHIDNNVKPVSKKPHTIPFAYREKVTAKINSLIEKDIVEPVEGPTSWVSPIVVAPKSG
ncbi:Uncharacterized protein K02A2.6 [Exaiptasia diaphana]|nr:Uncharacterized protein K02A2.6 [Exaiptasia diaphana]